jgi:shikimate dehydrogenase
MSERRAPLVAGLIGWPVAQSKSPLIHNFWLQKCGIDGQYVRFPVRPGDAASALKAMVPLGLTGLQATMPHKRACFDAVDVLTPQAKALGAVNTVSVRDDGRLEGHNTDFGGFLEPLAEIDLQGKIVTVLGAGGAAAAIVAGLASKRPARIHLINRSRQGIETLLADLGDALAGVEVVPGDWSALDSRLGESSLVANATLLGMSGQPPLPLDVAKLPADAIVYDIVTHPRETEMLKAARARGLRTFDGMHMLVGQAREAFELLFGAVAPAKHDDELRELLTR